MRQRDRSLVRMDEPAGFVHQACLYGSDGAFLATAVPFIEEGLRRQEPVLVTTTSANLDLLSEVVGDHHFDHADSHDFGRRTGPRIAGFYRYWQRHANARTGSHVRVLAEPVWVGRSDREARAWRRMESALNAVLATTNIWMICPYDLRTAEADDVSDACRTHPARVDRAQVRDCPEFVDPVAFTRGCDVVDLPAAPEGVEAWHFSGDRGDLRALRWFVGTRAGALGLTGPRWALFELAAAEVAGFLAERGSATVRIWATATTIVCDFHVPVRLADPFLGYRPPRLPPEPDDGLWLARQVCEFVDLANDDSGCTVRLEVLGARAEEMRQAPAPYRT